jgi:hypothetical protein
MVLCALFGVGSIILMDYANGALLLTVAAAAAGYIYWDFQRRGWSTAVE